VFHRYVANVLYGYCKSRSRCRICCNGYTCMFQLYVLSVFICFIRMLQVFNLDVAKVCLDVAYVWDAVGDPRGFPCVHVKRRGHGWLGQEAAVGSMRRGWKKWRAHVRRGYLRKQCPCVVIRASSIRTSGRKPLHITITEHSKLWKFRHTMGPLKVEFPFIWSHNIC
jgi:hypothetical protein